MKRQIITLLTIFIVTNIIITGCADEDKKLAYRLEDDYYEYINQTALNAVTIPADAGSWSHFYDLGNKSYENLNTILLETVETKDQYEKGSPNQRISDLYLTAIDKTSRNDAKLGNLQNYIDIINQAETIQEYMKATASIGGELGNFSILSFGQDIDMGDTSKYAYYISGPDLVLGKEILEDENSSKLWKYYKDYVQTIMRYLGENKADANQIAEDIFTFQKNMASYSLSLPDSGNPSQIYNPYNVEELTNLLSQADIAPYLQNHLISQNASYIVTDIQSLKKLNDYLNETNLSLLKNYSKFILINDYAPYLTIDVRDSYLKFNQRLTGAKEIESDEKLASKLTQSLTQIDFGKIYVQNFFSEQDKKAVESMAKDIIKTYTERIDQLDWMNQTTKEAAKKKLKTMVLKIGYPVKWPNYLENAQITSPEAGGCLINNILELTKSHHEYERNKFNSPVDRTEWMMMPQTVNAYYSPLGNEIVFPAAILQPPFYDASAPYEENLGGIGMVIAHEVTHAFDNSGAQYDENGNYKTWWTKEDYHNFNTLTRTVSDYYDSIEVYNGLHVNGKQTLGENIADLGAISCVTELAGDDPQKLQLLFKRYAQIWAAKYTEETILLRLNTDVHSPSKVRVNAVLSTTNAFYKAYKLHPTDKMYLPPEKRVKIW